MMAKIKPADKIAMPKIAKFMHNLYFTLVLYGKCWIS